MPLEDHSLPLVKNCARDRKKPREPNTGQPARRCGALDGSEGREESWNPSHARPVKRPARRSEAYMIASCLSKENIWRSGLLICTTHIGRICGETCSIPPIVLVPAHRNKVSIESGYCNVTLWCARKHADLRTARPLTSSRSLAFLCR